VHVDALDRAARLAGIEVAAVDEVLDRSGERRVGAHVRRVLAAKLEAGADEALGRGALHRMPARHRAGKRDIADARIADHPGGARVVHVKELEHALRQPCRAEGLRVAFGDERRLRRHLEDHAVAGEQRRHDRVHRREPGVVPRRDHQHHAVRLAPDEALEAFFLLHLQVRQRLFGDAARYSARS
jgi:hypothetical protein